MPKLYFPYLVSPAGPSGVALPCGMDATEDLLFRLLKVHPEQDREQFICDERLVRAANFKCLQMSRNNAVEHTLEGISANENVRNHGYQLPDYYAKVGNNIESLSGGNSTVGDAIDGWLNSPSHYPHVFGKHRSYRAQTVIGVGYLDRPSEKGWNYWWCFLSAPPE